MKTFILLLLPALILTMLLSGCGSNVVTPISIPTATDTATAMPTLPTLTITMTPDVCAPENIRAEVDKVHRHMREFDDSATLAASIPREQLSESIANLQRIRREAEDELVPACLTSLRQYQVNHMNFVINSLIAFMRTSDPFAIGNCTNVESNTEAEVICQNFTLAGQQRDKYLLELARLLGITPAPATAGPVSVPSETPTPP